MWIDAGSRAETNETNGTAHFLEHLAFKVRHARCHTDWDIRALTLIEGHCQAIAAAIGAGD